MKQVNEKLIFLAMISCKEGKMNNMNKNRIKVIKILLDFLQLVKQSVKIKINLIERDFL